MLKLGLFLSFLVSCTVAANLDYNGWFHIELYHAIDINEPEKFSMRGNLTLTSADATTITQESLSTTERLQLKELAAKNRFYRLKAVVAHQDGSKQTFRTASKACALASSQLNDALWISLDHNGSIIGITQTVYGNNGCGDIDVDALGEFNTMTLVSHMEMGPIPDTASFIQKIEREREARDRGDVKDNRGFFAKYWMYIVPVAILVLISGATNPDANAAAAR